MRGAVENEKERVIGVGVGDPIHCQERVPGRLVKQSAFLRGALACADALPRHRGPHPDCPKRCI